MPSARRANPERTDLVVTDEGRQVGDVLDGRRRLTITRAQNLYVGWALTLLLYVVVLNLFVEYVDSIIIDSFTISIFTAVVLLILLVAILGFEHRVGEAFGRREGRAWKVAGAAATVVILFLSKFVILEVIDIVFGEHVELGGFVEVIFIVIALIVSQKVSVAVWVRLGEGPSGAAEGTLHD
jgi:hypothetical protein